MIAAVPEKEGVFSEIRTAARHTVIYGLGNVLTKVIGFLMLPFYTRYLLPSDYGLLEILDLSISLLGMVIYMGISPAVLRSYAAANSPREKKGLVSSAFLFTLATGTLVFFLGFGFVRPASILLFGPKVPPTFLLLSFGSFVLTYITNLPRTYLRALEKSGTLTIIELVGVFCMLALNIYLIAILKIGALAIVISPFIVGVCQTILLAGWLLRTVGVHLDFAQLRGMIRFGTGVALANVAVFALNFSDRLFLQHLRSLDEVGIYAVGYKFAFMLSFVLIQPFNIMWQTRMYLIPEKARQDDIFNQIFVLYSAVLTYGALALSVLSPEAVCLMAAPKFQAAQTVVPVISLAYVFCGIGYYMQTGMYLAAKTKVLGMVSAAAAILNLVLNYFLIANFGMMGAAWATLISFAAIAAGSYYFSERVFPLPLSVGRVMRMIAIGVFIYLAGHWLESASFLATLVIKCLLLVSFPCLLWKLHLISPAEGSTILSAKDKLVGMLRLSALVAGKALAND